MHESTNDEIEKTFRKFKSTNDVIKKMQLGAVLCLLSTMSKSASESDKIKRLMDLLKEIEE